MIRRLFISWSLRFAGLLFLALTASSLAGDMDEMARMIEAAGKFHGEEAKKRVAEWLKVIQKSTMLPEEEKLIRVNSFFNHIPAGQDITIWGVNDYWATPMEFLIANRGDCEDYAIAKYFSLQQLGVPEARLRITYVTAFLPERRLLQPHMVLGYYPSPSAEPLILDNLVPAILPASKRTDLSPVFGFNGSGLWSAQQEKNGGGTNGGSLPGAWREMLQRMDTELGGAPAATE
jgi:predicted transglutaminase-like cysteine proteinase